MRAFHLLRVSIFREAPRRRERVQWQAGYFVTTEDHYTLQNISCQLLQTLLTPITACFKVTPEAVEYKHRTAKLFSKCHITSLSHPSKHLLSCLAISPLYIYSNVQAVFGSFNYFHKTQQLIRISSVLPAAHSSGRLVSALS